MKSPLSGGCLPGCVLLLIVVILSAEFAQSLPLVRRRRYTSLSEQTLAAHHNRHKNSKSPYDVSDRSTSALVADGVFETEETHRVPDEEDVAQILEKLQNML